MWIQYGDNGSGCRIEFEVELVHNFKKVKYLAPGQKTDDKLDNIVLDLLKYVKSSNSVISEYARGVITAIEYQIKNPYYEHEREVRCSMQQTPQLAKVFEKPKPDESFPRLYCELQTPIRIKSVILGPKCPTPQATALFLIRKGVPEVRMSSIKFR